MHAILDKKNLFAGNNLVKPDIYRHIFFTSYIYLNVIFVHNTKLASIDLKRITIYSTFCRKERQKIIDTGIRYIYLLTED